MTDLPAYLQRVLLRFISLVGWMGKIHPTKKKKIWIRKSMSAPPTLPTVASSTCRLQSIMHYFHAIPLIPTQVLLLCSSCAHFIIDKTPRTRRGTNISSSHWCPSLPTLHPHCCNQWSECHCPHTGCCLTCFSELSQLTLPNVFAAAWWFAHAPCYYSGIMLKCFWFSIIPILCSAQWTRAYRWYLCTITSLRAVAFSCSITADLKQFSLSSQVVQFMYQLL